MQREKRKVVAGLFLILAAVRLIAVDVESSPGWLVLEKGKQLFDASEYGDAMYHFRKARERLGGSPEAEYWIGRVFEAEGEYSLAARQYQAAIEKRQLLLVPGHELGIRRRVAQIYFTTRDFAGYESELEAIIAYDSRLRNDETEIVLDPQTIGDVLIRRGYDKLLELYRVEDYGALEAYYDLGVYEYRTGFFETAVEHLAFAFAITHTVVINHLIELDPEYRFATLPELLRKANGVRLLVDYLYDVDAFGQIYALAAALYQSGETVKRELAEELWRIVREYDQRDWWSEKAIRQLQSPFTDDFMIIFP